DPARIEDSETRKEREETIRALEAGEKLEDVEKLQDAVAEANDKAKDGTVDGSGGAPDETADPTSRALSMIQVLAAGAAAILPAKDGAKEAGTAEAGAASVPESESGESVERALAAEPDEELEEAKEAIFTLRVDENGIYDLITRQLAAA